jgi:hypothetical protein
MARWPRRLPSRADRRALRTFRLLLARRATCPPPTRPAGHAADGLPAHWLACAELYAAAAPRALAVSPLLAGMILDQAARDRYAAARAEAWQRVMPGAGGP